MIDKQNPWLDVVAFFAGALLPVAFAPISFYPLAIIIPAIMFWIWQDSSNALAFRRGYLFGFGMFAVGVSWVYIAISDFGFTSAPVAFLLTHIFVAFLALFPAIQALVSVMLIRNLNRLLAMPVFIAMWVLFEWIRGWFMTGFPWLNLGYSFIDSPLVGYAPILGVYGISLMAVISAALLLKFAERRSTLTVSLILFASGIWLVGGSLKNVLWTEKKDQPVNVAIVQASLSQITKWDPEQIMHRMNTYADMTEPLWGKYDLVMWPENALTILWQDAPYSYRQRLKEQAKKSGTTLVIGLPYGELDTHYYSSLLVLGKTQSVYNKRHLVPFGEYVPLPDFMKKLAGFFDLPMSGFSRGAPDQKYLLVAGEKMAPSICYEDAFGEELIDFLPEASMLINGSNNAWYGKSWAPFQHLQIARMRAVETQRESIRATTTGISALIDYHGKFIKKSPQFKPVILTGKMQPRQGATPYVRYGNYPVISFVSVLVGLFFSLALFNRIRSKPVNK
ncbi:MAG: apolipoprotein N-acyltransferase [Thioalkalispiraceae bacterium]|jgi:apolipoprotein N-acyltransferase